MTNRNDEIRMVSANKMDRLACWTDRKPTIALMGEFSAGKSTLLNLLIGQSILPTQVTATQLPPVWLRHGTDDPYRVDKDGTHHPVDLQDLASVPVKSTRYIRIYAEAEMLEQCDLLDTPGISDPKIPTSSWIRTIGYANAVLWCTHAGQAWRESERSTWTSLPERLRQHSLLMVTRADKLVSDTDRKKIDRRLERETGDLFSGRHLISLTAAMAARDFDPEGWAKSGAEGFMTEFLEILNTINVDRGHLLWRYQIDENAVDAPRPKAVMKSADQDDTVMGAQNIDMVEPAMPVPDSFPADEPVIADETVMQQEATPEDIGLSSDTSSIIPYRVKTLRPTRVNKENRRPNKRLSRSDAESVLAKLKVEDSVIGEEIFNLSKEKFSLRTPPVSDIDTADESEPLEQYSEASDDIATPDISADAVSMWDNMGATDMAAVSDTDKVVDLVAHTSANAEEELQLTLETDVAYLLENPTFDEIEDDESDDSTQVSDGPLAEQFFSRLGKTKPSPDEEYEVEAVPEEYTKIDLESVMHVMPQAINPDCILQTVDSGDQHEAHMVKLIWDDIQSRYDTANLPVLRASFDDLLAQFDVAPIKINATTDPVVSAGELNIDKLVQRLANLA
ncbi:MAG: dynamin family protein [Paracoccaceae bacterium]